MSGPLNLDTLRAKVLEDIHRERDEKRRANEGGHRDSAKGGFYEFLESHLGFFFIGDRPGVLIEHPYALVGFFRCPWYRCGHSYFVAKFLSMNEGRNFFHVCSECRQRVMTLRDFYIIAHPTTLPVQELLKHRIPDGAYDTACRKILEHYEIEYAKWKNRPTGKTREIVGETDYHRAITLRTSVEKEEDTLEHINAGFRKRGLRKLWGI